MLKGLADCIVCVWLYGMLGKFSVNCAEKTITEKSTTSKTWTWTAFGCWDDFTLYYGKWTNSALNERSTSGCFDQCCAWI